MQMPATLVRGRRLAIRSLKASDAVHLTWTSIASQAESLLSRRCSSLMHSTWQVMLYLPAVISADCRE